MASTIQLTKKVGGSLMVRIPKEIVEQEGIHEGEALILDISKAKKDWFGCFKNISSMKKSDKLNLHG